MSDKYIRFRTEETAGPVVNDPRGHGHDVLIPRSAIEAVVLEVLRQFIYRGRTDGAAHSVWTAMDRAWTHTAADQHKWGAGREDLYAERANRPRDIPEAVVSFDLPGPHHVIPGPTEVDAAKAVYGEPVREVLADINEASVAAGETIEDLRKACDELGIPHRDGCNDGASRATKTADSAAEGTTGANESGADPEEPPFSPGCQNTIPAELVREIVDKVIYWANEMHRLVHIHGLPRELTDGFDSLVAWIEDLDGAVAPSCQSPAPHGTVDAHFAEQMEDPEFRAEYLREAAE